MYAVQQNKLTTKTICLTAYKALLLLKYLTVSAMTKEQISDLFKNDEIIPNEFSVDMLRIIINSLKECGCDFSRPVLSNDYKYELLKNSFLLKLTDKEVDLWNKFHKNLCVKNSWENVLALDFLTDKICMLIEDKEITEKLRSYLSFSNIDYELIFEIQKYCKNKNTVVFEYYSGRKIIEFEMHTDKLKFERGRLYVCGYSTRFSDYSYIRLDKIKSAKVVNISKDIPVHQKLVVEYKMFCNDYILNEHETLKEKTKDYLLIEYLPENGFQAVQRFLEMGCDCEVISPKYIRDEIINTLKVLKEESCCE